MNRSELRSTIRETLPDHSIWSDTMLNTWIGSAIRSYSVYFPLQTSSEIACSTGIRTYSLLGLDGLRGVLRVAYPAGENARWLLRWSEQAVSKGLPVYALRGEPPHTLLLGPEVKDGESVEILYLADYPLPSNDQVDLGLPEVAVELVSLYVLWQSARRLEMQAASEPLGNTYPEAVAWQTSRNLQQAYHNLIESLLSRQAPGGYSGPWKDE